MSETSSTSAASNGSIVSWSIVSWPIVGASLLAAASAQAPASGSVAAPQGQAQERPAEPRQTPSDRFQPQWQGLPKQAPFNGFPTLFPRGLGAFGAYPSQAGETGPVPGGLPGGLFSGLPGGALRPPVPATVDEEPDWPQGLGQRGSAPLPYVPGQALLVRLAERVWWKAPDEDAFVPVYFYDRLRSAVAGTEVEVRQSGEFELLFHGGGRCVAQGQTRLGIVAMDDKSVVLRMPMFTKVRVQTAGREYSFVLPDGSTLVLPADVPPPSPEVPPDGPALVVLDRASEPGWLAGRAAIFNGGQRPVRWRHALGETTIEPGRRVQFFLSPPTQPMQANLATEAVQAQPVGDGLACAARGEGFVAWSGARFTLDAGTTVRLQPLLGQPFDAPAERAPAGGVEPRR
jgi:hypothetical protein